jgi:hypothetical protein
LAVPGAAVARSLRWSAVATLLLGALTLPAVADQRSAAADPARPMAFDLPAQPLASALEGYSIASGWQVIYNGSLADGRRSTGVKGEFTPDAALRLLLAGTGLAPHYKAADSVILQPDPNAAPRPAATADTVDPALEDYYGLIQTGLQRALCASPQIRTGGYRLALGFWIGASGSVTRAALLGSTGRADIDASFEQAVRSLSIGAAPPVGFAQPVVLLVTPDLVARCGAAGAPVQPARAER